MSILDSFRAWLFPKQSASSIDKELQLVLRSSIEIVSAYGAILDGGTGSNLPTIKQSEQDLPYSKQSIAKAIAILQQAIEQPHMRTLMVQSLLPHEAQHVLSHQFGQSLKSGLALLDTFVPEAEIAAEHKLWDDALRLADRIDPGMRTRIENASALTQGDRAKKKAT